LHFHRFPKSAAFNRNTIQCVMSSHNLPPVICRVLFAATFLCSTSLMVRGDDITGTPPSLPSVIGTEITANVVDMIFLFDRVGAIPQGQPAKITLHAFRNLLLRSTRITLNTSKVRLTAWNLKNDYHMSRCWATA